MPFPSAKGLHFASRTVLRTGQDAEKPSRAFIFSVSGDIFQTARRVSQAHAGAGMVPIWLGHSDSHYIGGLSNFADWAPLPQIPQEFMRQGPRTKTSRGEAYNGREENGEDEGTG